LYVYMPNWVWPGDPTNQNYWGRLDMYWGAMSPEQMAATPKIRWSGDPWKPNQPITGWGCLSGGSLIGARKRVTARLVDRFSGTDVSNQSRPSFGAPAAPWDPSLATQPGRIYWGWGPDGVAEERLRMIDAGDMPITHLEITRRDIVENRIRHSIGLAMQEYYAGGPPTSSQGFKPPVWPANHADGASREHFRHGHAIRFAPGSTPIYPSAMPSNLRPWFDLLFYAVRDYGTRLCDTAGGGGWSWRVEPTARNLLPTGALSKSVVEWLFQAARDGQQQLYLVKPGSDSSFYV
jgi:hypothetical protein